MRAVLFYSAVEGRIWTIRNICVWLVALRFRPGKRVAADEIAQSSFQRITLPTHLTCLPADRFSLQAQRLIPPTRPDCRVKLSRAILRPQWKLSAANYAEASKLDTGSLTASAIDAMLKTLDPHSNYYTAAEYQDLLGEHESEYSGTGSSIAGFFRNGSLDTYILSTFPQSPAARSGLRFGDRITAVDGQSVVGRTPDEVREKVRGKRGTIVRITVERADTKALEVIELPARPCSRAGCPGRLSIKAGRRVHRSDRGLQQRHNGRIRDRNSRSSPAGYDVACTRLGGNGGGILDQSIKVAEKFLPAGAIIVSQRGRYEIDNRTWKAAGLRPETFPLVLLVDENTASASEVLAGALQDNDRAIIVGEKTFGKGLVQSVLSLPYGTGLTLTAARYYTPSGRSIQRDYADTGLYDYFNHRGAAVDIGTTSYAAKTLTNRVVYGGDGIKPDAAAKQAPLTPAQSSLLDPLFFFAREIVNGRSDVAGSAVANANQHIRQQILFGEPVVDDEMLAGFGEFIAAEKAWKVRPDILARENAFIKDTLRYDLMLAAFGMAAANRAKIESDPEVRLAVESLPAAARLSTAAQKARSNRTKEKRLVESCSQRAKVETGGIRKTTHRSTCKTSAPGFLTQLE